MVNEDQLGGDDQPPIFVYGSLRHGGENYGLLRGRTLSEVPAVLHGARMYSLHWYPIILDADPGEVIHGELMIVRPQVYWGVIATLDQLEGYAEGCDEECLYRRLLRCVTTPSGREVRAWVYVGTPARVHELNPAPVTSGDWMHYRRERLLALRGG
jgi:gamma-glutamylcyclotransferase (GGCT)/AIG2-like uncharacterized protein YtfP